MLLLLFIMVAGYGLAIALHMTAHRKAFVCVGCRNRKRWARVVVMAAIAFALFTDHQAAPADFMFLGLALLVELT